MNGIKGKNLDILRVSLASLLVLYHNTSVFLGVFFSASEIFGLANKNTNHPTLALNPIIITFE